MLDRVAAPLGGAARARAGAAWPVRVDLQLEDGLGEQAVDRWVQSACVLCSHGCGLEVAVQGRPDRGVRAGQRTGSTGAGWAPKGLLGCRPTTPPTGSSVP